MITIKKLMLTTALLSICGSALAQGTAQIRVDIQPQPLRTALQDFGAQAGLQVVFKAEDVAKEGVTSPRVVGQLSPREALEKLLANTGLKFEFVNARTVRIVGKKVQAGAGEINNIRLAQAEAASAAPAAAGPNEADTKGIPEILVRGSRGASADIRRTNDDVQPYMVFDAEDLRNSMAASVDDFLRERLPMNQSLTRVDDNNLTGENASQGNMSRIDLRGLGAEETLILVNGRRRAGAASLAGTLQPDINGIPLSAIERIEVLPSTAGGIYGGGATGGVVNIVLKRDYNSITVAARYDGTVDGGGAERRLDAIAGFSVGRRTNVMITGNIRDGNPLYVGDRDFALRSRELLYRNNPDAFLAAANPIFGRTTNIRSVNINPVTGTVTASTTPLVLRNGTSLGTVNAHVAPGSDGYALDGAFAFQPGYNLELADATFGNQYSILTVPKARSLQLNLRHEFSDRISAFIDVSRLENNTVRMGTTSLPAPIFTLPATLAGGAPNPANPFTTPIRISVPLVGFDNNRLEMPSDSLSEQAAVGVIVNLGRNWIAQAEYTMGRAEWTNTLPLQNALTPAGITALTNGTLQPLRDVNLYPFDFSPYYPTEGASSGTVTSSFPTDQESGTLRLSGPLMKLPGGRLQLAALLERREEFTGERFTSLYLGSALMYNYFAEVGSSTDSAYAELTAPLFSRINARPGIDSLELVASYRYDDTTTRSSPFLSSFVFVPSPDSPRPAFPYNETSVTGNQFTLGFRYAPVQSVALRASFGKGVLPPSTSQLSVVDFSSFGLQPSAMLTDPRRGGSLITAQPPVAVFTTGGSLNLRPELSESISVGLIFKPSVLPGLRLSLDYTNIQKTDEIGMIAQQSLLDDEDSFPGAIVRNDLTPADAALGFTGGTIREFHSGQVNIAEVKVEAFDLQATYDWDTRFGSFAANVVGTVQPTLAQRATPTSVERNAVGYSNGTMKLRANAGLRWTLGNVDLGWNMQYLDSYLTYSDTASVASRNTTILTQGSPVIPSQTYHDVFGRYRFGERQGFASSLLRNLELQLGIQNVFNTRPPILATTVPNGLGSVYARGANPRMQRYSFSIRKNFE